jgi:hypothetical protein
MEAFRLDGKLSQRHIHWPLSRLATEAVAGSQSDSPNLVFSVLDRQSLAIDVVDAQNHAKQCHNP